MEQTPFLVRRATVDDLPGLATLWARCGLQVLDLERHLTEFQLVSTWDGDLVAAMALRIAGQEGWLHSEAFATPDQPHDEIRSLLWDRMRNLARNHGLTRLWTLEEAPFWCRVAGFKPAQPDDSKRLPPGWGSVHQRWWVAVLRQEMTGTLSLEQEFELFQQASRASLDRVLEQTRRLRVAGYCLAAALFLGVLGLAVYLAIRGASERGRARRMRP